MSRVLLPWIALAIAGIAGAAEPLELLRQYPALYRLHQSYPAYHRAFADYANMQGFVRPIENLAVQVHEILHVDSFSHQGFFVDGVYYEPYLRNDAWPRLTNRQVEPHLQEIERGVIFRRYARNTPNNHLGNVVDEINAYAHVLPFVCRHEPESAERQVANLLGFLHLAEGYLRTLRTALPADYVRFAGNRASRGALVLIVHRAWKGLQECGVPADTIPAAEMRVFMATPTGGE